MHILFLKNVLSKFRYYNQHKLRQIIILSVDIKTSMEIFWLMNVLKLLESETSILILLFHSFTDPLLITLHGNNNNLLFQSKYIELKLTQAYK